MFLEALSLGALALGQRAHARSGWGDVAPWFRAWRASRPLDPKLIPRLRDAVGRDGRVLVPGDADWDALLVAFNQRTQVTPALRVMVDAPGAVSAAVAWAREHAVPFAIRGGGHSYEGFSQSAGLVIDMRPLNSIAIDGEAVRVGSGATLGQVYAAVGKRGLAFAAGSCPDVGIAGQTLGGGFGFLARRFGLSCDNVVAVELVTAEGVVTTRADDDLFWALRGAGSGSFGVVTRLDFDAHPLARVARFSTRWTVPIDDAVNVMSSWQAWAPHAPDAITSMLSLGGRKGQEVALTMHGQSTDSESALQSELARVMRDVGLKPELALKTSSASWLASTGVGDGEASGLSTIMKGKSDYVERALSADGMRTLFTGLCAHAGMIRVHCDGYGGAVARVPRDATAFVHRAGTLFSMQYGSTWHDPKATPKNVAAIRAVYDAMRTYVSGGAYCNYPDLDLDDWARRYWGDNVARLRRVKATVDPDDLFHHAQSVPV